MPWHRARCCPTARESFFGDKAGRALEVIKAGQSIQRNLAPPDLVGAAIWLVSDASRFVTGQTIAIDGGTVML